MNLPKVTTLEQYLNIFNIILPCLFSNQYRQLIYCLLGTLQLLSITMPVHNLLICSVVNFLVFSNEHM